MKRREFLKTSVVATGLASLGATALSPATAVAAAGGKQEYYELRRYRLKSADAGALLEGYLEKAALPAWNKLGIKPVGVFKEKETKEPAVFVLLPHANVETLVRLNDELLKDRTYQSAGAEYLQTAKTNPGFERIDSWLLLAFAGMPRIELAAHSKEKTPSRLFELRTYESYSEAKAARKVDMFNDGEIDIMREVGLAPVFFGAGLVGPNLPHLTYMTSGASEEAHKQHWEAFGKHPKWDQMKNDPKYADTVSKITKWMLYPTSYSQI